MMGKLRSAESAARFGHGCGRAVADTLRIEIVSAIHLGLMEHLDRCCWIRGPFGDWRESAGAFATEFEDAWWEGLRARCGDIIDRLNSYPEFRLPPEPESENDDMGDY